MTNKIFLIGIYPFSYIYCYDSAANEINMSFKNIYEPFNHYIDKSIINLNNNISYLFNDLINDLKKIKKISMKLLNQKSKEYFTEQFNNYINMLVFNRINYNQILTIYLIDETCKMAAYGNDVIYKYFEDIEEIILNKKLYYNDKYFYLFTQIGINVINKKREKEFIKKVIAFIKKWDAVNQKILNFYYELPEYYYRKLRIKHRIFQPLEIKWK